MNWLMSHPGLIACVELVFSGVGIVCIWLSFKEFGIARQELIQAFRIERFLHGSQTESELPHIHKASERLIAGSLSITIASIFVVHQHPLYVVATTIALLLSLFMWFFSKQKRKF